MSNGQVSHSSTGRDDRSKELTESFVPEVFSEFGNSQDDLVTNDVFGNDIFGLEVTKSGDIQTNEENNNGATQIEENISELLAGLPFQSEDSFTDTSCVPDLEFSMSSVSSSHGENQLFVRSCGDFNYDHVHQATSSHGENQLFVRSCGDFHYDHVPQASSRKDTTGQSVQPYHSRNHKRYSKSRNGHAHRRVKSSDFEEFCSLACYQDNLPMQPGMSSIQRRSPRQSTRDVGARRTKSGDFGEFYDRKSPVKRSKPRNLSHKKSPRRGVGANGPKTSEPVSSLSQKNEIVTKSPIHSRLDQPQSAALHRRSQTVASPNKNKLRRSRSGDVCEYHSTNNSKASYRRTRRPRAMLQAGHDRWPESQKRNSLQRARSEENLGILGMNLPVRQQRRLKDLQHYDPQPQSPTLMPQNQKCSISPRKSSLHPRENKSPKSQERTRLPKVQPEELEKFRKSKSPKRDYNKILSRAPQSKSLTTSQSATLRAQRTSKGLDKISSERQLEVFMDVNNTSWTAQVPVFEHFDKPAPGPWQTRREAHDSYRRSL